MANAKVYETNAWFKTSWGEKAIVNIEAMSHKEAVEIASVIPGLVVRNKAMSIHKGGRWSSKEQEIDNLRSIFTFCEVYFLW